MADEKGRPAPFRMTPEKVLVVGSGILGLAHAITAREAGHEVTLVERDGRPLGASVRNFGTLWPIGCAAGPEREQALEGARRWGELAGEAGFWIDRRGSLSLAYREEAWSSWAVPGGHSCAWLAGT